MKKDIFKGISVSLLYIFFSTFLMIILSLLGIRYSQLSFNNKVLFNIISDFLLILIITIIFYQTIKDNFIDYKKNIKEYLYQYLRYWVLAVILMVVSNLIISSITNIKVATNQKILLEAFHKVPIYTIVLSVFLSPILEELVFRLSIRKIIKNDYLYIICSGFIFGLIHLTIGVSSKELLYIIPYSIPGFIFAYTLVKSQNIFVPVSLHFIHNALLILAHIILLLF